MARSSIYKSEVVRARDKLLAMGRYPSIDAVRIELGNTGSKGTIHRYLKEIEEEEGGLAGTKVAVSEAIQDLVARLAERLHEESDQRIAAFSEKQSGEVAALNETIASLRHDVESFRSQSEHLALSLSAEKSSHAETQTKLQDERIASAQVRQRLQDMEGQLAAGEAHRQSLEDKHRHARETLEHFRAAAKEQREQEQRQAKQQVQFLRGELRAATESLNAKQQEIVRSHEDNARIASELNHQSTELRRIETEVRQLRTVREQLVAIDLKRQQLKTSLEQADTQLAELRADNQSKSNQLLETDRIARGLEADLSAARASLASYERILQALPFTQAVDANGGAGQSLDAVSTSPSNED